jgi:hypothetical protein
MSTKQNSPFRCYWLTRIAPCCQTFPQTMVHRIGAPEVPAVGGKLLSTWVLPDLCSLTAPPLRCFGTCAGDGLAALASAAGMTRGEDGTRDRAADVLLMPTLRELLKDFGETIEGAIAKRTAQSQMKLWTDLGVLERLRESHSALAAKCKSPADAVRRAVRYRARVTHRPCCRDALLGGAKWASCLPLLLRSSSWSVPTTWASLRSWRCRRSSYLVSSHPGTGAKSHDSQVCQYGPHSRCPYPGPHSRTLAALEFVLDELGLARTGEDDEDDGSRRSAVEADIRAGRHAHIEFRVSLHSPHPLHIRAVQVSQAVSSLLLYRRVRMTLTSRW